jgi:sec-independent protein translocase protein TatB
MFDLGFTELLLTAVVALLVLGPERLPRAARMGGLMLRRARASWYSVKSQFERELADEELKRSLQATRAEFQGLREELQAPLIEARPTPGGAGVDPAAATGPAAAEPPRIDGAPPAAADGAARDPDSATP